MSNANPLLLDIPGELTSRRLLLRTPRAGDGEIITPTVRESLAELKPWMPWATDDYSVQAGEEWCRRAAANFISRTQLQFLIFLKAENRHIGNIGAFNFIWEIPSCEIGCWLHTARTHQGFMTEATQCLMELLRDILRMQRVQIRAETDNAKSGRVAELAGFQLEGILRNDSLAVSGKIRSTSLYSWVPQ
jgi:ribosomal-protein-serine acetyltransferase